MRKKRWLAILGVVKIKLLVMILRNILMTSVREVI